MRNRKPTAVKFTDGDGFFTFRCKTKEQAKVAIEDYIRNDPEYEGVVVEIEKIEEDVMYLHRRCYYYSIGENMCNECGEQTRGAGRKTFTFYL